MTFIDKYINKDTKKKKKKMYALFVMSVMIIIMVIIMGQLMLWNNNGAVDL